ncbi:hypothetical protein [Actinoplanes sp. L3-i22]|uniref:hypothetical protein n=1 Tax=Actinoplanes sp. L3-i22 TaxID=2836373 RepID=UPI001C78D8E0|nr:hypothetical protein [Actinoplanes sp. L3-i22]BCY08024.1 hypothetical protein L3i22_031120 [Actinoplanes sp. L3-i22]
MAILAVEEAATSDAGFVARRRRKLCAAGAALVALLLSGCEADQADQDGYFPLGPGESLGELRQQAAQALDRYDKAAAAAGPSASVDVSPPPWDAYNTPPGFAIQAAKGDPAATRMTVTFTGAVRPATEPCGIDYVAEAVESARAIVVIVLSQNHASGETCTLVGAERTADVNLAQPLGQRAVLEVQQGQPVPVERAPITK